MYNILFKTQDTTPFFMLYITKNKQYRVYDNIDPTQY